MLFLLGNSEGIYEEVSVVDNKHQAAEIVLCLICIFSSWYDLLYSSIYVYIYIVLHVIV